MFALIDRVIDRVDRARDSLGEFVERNIWGLIFVGFGALALGPIADEATIVDVALFSFCAYLIGRGAGTRGERERPAREAKRERDRERERRGLELQEDLRRRYAEYEQLSEDEKQRPEWRDLYGQRWDHEHLEAWKRGERPTQSENVCAADAEITRRARAADVGVAGHSPLIEALWALGIETLSSHEEIEMLSRCEETGEGFAWVVFADEDDARFFSQTCIAAGCHEGDVGIRPHPVLHTVVFPADRIAAIKVALSR
jgi:hypothetical protein